MRLRMEAEMRLGSLAAKILAKAGYQLQRTPVNAFADHPKFVEAMRGLPGLTLVDATRCFMLWQLALLAKSAPGEAAELGVYKGGTAKIIGTALAGAGKTLRLFDTFEGMPQTSADKDLHVSGDFGDTSLEGVKRLLSGVPDLSFHPGFFPESAKGLESKTFCFAHVDVDIYPSAKAACEYFWPRLTPGGIMVFDDYGSPSCPGAKRAVDEFFADKGRPLVYLPTGQAVAFRR